MSLSIFDLFSIGIGPSSSHTVGPMRAARSFLLALEKQNQLTKTDQVKVELFGSLGLTGKAHGSEKAILLGWEGELPENVDPETIAERLQNIREHGSLHLLGKKQISFDEKTSLIFYRNKNLPEHSNGMRFSALQNGKVILEKDYYSIGGGFVVEGSVKEPESLQSAAHVLPYSFQSADELLALGKEHNKKIYEMILENEKTWRSEEEIFSRLKLIWQEMQNCIRRGLKNEGDLPGGLHVKRRAPQLYQRLLQETESSLQDPLNVLDWVNLYALAVNEENAAGGKVVTAPTNGAAGIIPAVLYYFTKMNSGADEKKIYEFLLTAGAIGLLYKRNASISGAEVGCQGEVGVACSMAAAGLAAAKGGSNEQIENAAEIGMEHNLGLTCDPVGGLVQIPCIERNAMGAIKAINASRIALRGDGSHKISLDKVIKTMFQTGLDMQSQYKETSTGGLAVHIGVVEC